MSKRNESFKIERIPLEDNPDFNAYLDQQYDPVEIEGGQYKPSEVLNAVDPDAYRSALEEYRNHQAEQFQHAIFDEFPNPIAYNYYKAMRGYENERQRLDCLRDAWEALIYLLYAIVVGEFRSLGLTFDGAKVFTGPTQQKPLHFEHFMSDKINDKIGIMEGLLRQAADQGVKLVCADLVKDDVLTALRELNRKRNGFSHSSALSEREAQDQFISSAEIFLALLRRVADLQSIRLFRYQRSASHALECRFEDFSGHATTRKFNTLTLNTAQFQKCAKYLNPDTIVIKIGESIYGVSPIVYFVQRGGDSRLCFYKQNRNGQYLYSVVGESEQVPILEKTIADQFAALRELCH